MRRLLPIVLISVALGACKTGYVSDWGRDRFSIIGPQLLRFGLNVEQGRCVSQRLNSVPRHDVRQFQERAAAVRPAADVTLTPNNLRAIAASGGSRALTAALDAAIAECNVVAPTVIAAVETPQVPTTNVPPTTESPGTSGNPPVTSGGIPVDMTPVTPSTGPATVTGARTTWLNLGAAESGQSIAIDAMSIEQVGAARTAWFRMTDPDTGSRTNNLYRLRIDCEAHTVQPLALRQTDEAGNQVSLREYTPAEAVAGAAEAGTVLEIAYLSLCT